jgi:hypothetical protein
MLLFCVTGVFLFLNPKQDLRAVDLVKLVPESMN